MTWLPNEPYNQLPALPPGEFVVTPELSRHLVSARVALERLNNLLESARGAGALTAIFPIVEAQASSSIENIVTTNDTLFQNLAGVGSQLDPTTAKVWANRSAMQHGLAQVSSRPVSAHLAVQIATALFGHDVQVRSGSGTFIGDKAGPRYTPPVGDAVLQRLLGEWEAFINADTNLDPLIVIAMAHYQFEAIHPFHDGNGRTGRILNLLLMVQYGLVDFPALHISKAIDERRSEYYFLLREVTAMGDWEGWVLFMLQVIDLAARRACDQVRAMREIRDEAAAALADRGIKKANLVAELFFAYPYCRQHHVQEALEVSRPTAANVLEIAVREGILVPVEAGREKYYINHRLVALFD